MVSIVEEEQDKYTIIGTLYHTGKYKSIEDINVVNPQPYTNPYLNITQKVGSEYLRVLPIPQIQYMETIYDGALNLIITGFVSGISATICTGYSYEITRPDNSRYTYQSTSTGFHFTVNNVGEYTVRANAKGNPAKSAGSRYFDSDYDQSSLLVGYNQLADRSSIASIFVS